MVANDSKSYPEPTTVRVRHPFKVSTEIHTNTNIQVFSTIIQMQPSSRTLQGRKTVGLTGRLILWHWQALEHHLSTQVTAYADPARAYILCMRVTAYAGPTYTYILSMRVAAYAGPACAYLLHMHCTTKRPSMYEVQLEGGLVNPEI